MKYLILVLALFISPVYGAQTLLTATADAGTSSSFKITNNGKATVIIYAASGLTAGEYSDIQISHDGGTTFSDLYIDGAQVRLSSTNTAAKVHGPGIFRVDMANPTNATGVYLSTEASL